MLRVLSDALTAADARQLTNDIDRPVGGIRLHRSRAAATPTAVQLRLHRPRATLDDVVRFQPDATGCLRLSAIAHSSSPVRGSAGVRSRSAPILRPVHCRLEQGHSQSWSAAAPVRGRLPSLRDVIG